MLQTCKKYIYIYIFKYNKTKNFWEDLFSDGQSGD